MTRVVVIVTLFALPAAGITLNQVDDFQSGTLLAWMGMAAPTNVATGGPAGTGDRFLRISRATLGNLGTNNTAQWTGSYSAAGVERLRFDLNNLGTNPLALRISLFGPTDTWTTTDETVLAPGSGWVTVIFELDEGSLTRTQGSGTLASTLANVSTLLIRHDPDPISPSGQSNPVIGTLGIDNITALPAAPDPPEVPLWPAWVTPLASAVGVLLALRARARAKHA
jgi:hypothetical protein